MKSVLDLDQIYDLFDARCLDLKILAKDKQFKKFRDICLERSVNRKLDLTNLFLGPLTA